MVLLLFVFGFVMVVLWHSHLHWFSCGLGKVVVWFCHSARGSLGMVLVRCCYDLQRFAMVLRWLWHGFIIAFLWFWFVFSWWWCAVGVRNGFAMVLLRC